MMIQGNKINLRVIREEDLAEFFALWSSIANRGGFYSLTMRTETALKKRFFDNGCWGEENTPTNLAPKTMATSTMTMR